MIRRNPTRIELKLEDIQVQEGTAPVKSGNSVIGYQVRQRRRKTFA